MADIFGNLSKVERIEKAVQACAEDDQLTIRKAAKIYNVSHTTISRRLTKNTQSWSVAHRFQQLLTPVEERTLVKWVKQYYKWGLPLNLKQLRQFALEILRRKPLNPTGSAPFISQDWHRKLLKRNPEIRHVVARGLDRARASAVLKTETFTEYFELYSSIQREYGITPQDTYNMDEKGFAMGIMQQSHVFVPANKKEAFIRQDGNREWVSIIETISAAGESLPSYLIFKAIY
jgi:helix-turn-helix, Psq domain/Tc5 transposase DNA-binding domain